MSIEIHRVRVHEGRVRFEVECDNIDHFARIANEIMLYDHAGFAPVEPTAADYYAAKREAAQTATGREIPRWVVTDEKVILGHVPPFDTTLGGQPLPGGYLMADTEEPPLRAFTADECKAGGTD